MSEKLNDLATNQKRLESEVDQSQKEKQEVEEKLKTTTDAHLAAEKTLAENTQVYISRLRWNKYLIGKKDSPSKNSRLSF